MLLVRAVREVDPRHVETGLDQGAQYLGRRRRRPEGADDLGSGEAGEGHDGRERAMTGESVHVAEDVRCRKRFNELRPGGNARREAAADARDASINAAIRAASNARRHDNPTSRDQP